MLEPFKKLAFGAVMDFFFGTKVYKKCLRYYNFFLIWQTTEKYSESILKEIKAANSEVDSTNMPGTSKDHLETDEEYFSEQKKRTWIRRF